MKKRIISAVSLALSMALLAGCTSGGNDSKVDGSSQQTPQLAENATLRLWGAQEDQTMLEELVTTFKAKYPDTTWDITLGVVSESDAATEVLKDTEAAADVFAFASDQLGELQSAGALYRVTRNKDAIIEANSDASIVSAMVGDELYAYPSSADTYFLYYDKKIFSDDDVKSLETILSKELDSGVTNFSFDIDNGWYNSGFFFAAGATLFGEEGTDGTKCDFNNEKGLLAGKYLISMGTNKNFKNHDDAMLKAGFTARQLGATVTGAWNAEDIKNALGDDMGVAKLPELTFEDGTTANLGSMANFKLYGVNSQTKNPLEAMALAEFLTSEEAQKVRFEQRSFAPTNVKLASDTAVMGENPVIAAIAAQNEFATLQSSIPQMGNFWVPAEAFGAGIEDGSINEGNLQEKLDTLVTSILSTLG